MDEFLRQLLQKAIDQDASDIHIKPNGKIRFRVNGILHPTNVEATLPRIRSILQSVLREEKTKKLQADHELDYPISLDYNGQLHRFRANFFYTKGDPGIIIRCVEPLPPEFDNLSLPSQIKDIANAKSGIFFVTGPTGSGKSTTLAAILHIINKTKQYNIITIEDPIEYVHPDISSSVVQREVGIDTNTYETGMVSALRQDPDVILLGEIRSRETAQTAMSAAMAGHLVLTTMHTSSAVDAIERLLTFFPSEDQKIHRRNIAESLLGIACQRLIPGKKAPRVPVVEVLFNKGRVTPAIEDPTYKGDLGQILSESHAYGMQTFDQHLLNLVKNNEIKREIALDYATNAHNLEVQIRKLMQQSGIRS